MATADLYAAPSLDMLGERSAEAQNEVLRVMRECFAASMAYEEQNRREQVEWQRFYAGQHWRPDEEAQRYAAGRPCLTINTLGQYERQITNEMRKNMPALNVLPVGDGADKQTAKILKGIIRHCNERSHAESVRQLAFDAAVRLGAGYYRMCLEYDAYDSFDREPRIAGIRNQFAVLLDHTGTSSVGRDACYGFVFEQHEKRKFKEEWGISESDLSMWHGPGDTWIAPDQVRVAEYFYKDYQRLTLAQMSDGSTMLLEPYLLQEPLEWLQMSGISTRMYQEYVSHLLTPRKEGQFYPQLLPWIREQAQPQRVMAWMDGLPPEFTQYVAQQVSDLIANVRQVRPTQLNTIRWIKTNGYCILEESIWPGEHIPLIRVVGQELDLDNRVRRSGIVADAMDPMRLEDYMVTMMCENVALAPIPGWVGAQEQFEGYEEFWDNANREPRARLPYNPHMVAGQLLPPPSRNITEPPINAIALTLQTMQQYTQNAIGMYQANLGAPSREKSGRALQVRDEQADTGSFHYVKNLGDAMTYEGELYLEVIPRELQPGKVQRIIGDDGSVSMVQLADKRALADQHAQMQQQAQAQGLPPPLSPEETLPDGVMTIYDPTMGKFDVRVSIGPSYQTKREEAIDQLLQLLQTPLGEVMVPVANFIIGKMDFDGAEELQELVKQLPGQIVEEQGQDNKDAQLQQARQMLQKLQQDLQKLDAFAKQERIANEQLAQENKSLKEAHDLKALDVQDNQRETDLKARELEHKIAMDERQMALEEAKMQLEARRVEIEAAYKRATVQQQEENESQIEIVQ